MDSSGDVGPNGSVSFPPFHPKRVALAIAKQIQVESRPVVENWSRTVQEASRSVKNKAKRARQQLVEFNATIQRQARERINNDQAFAIPLDSRQLMPRRPLGGSMKRSQSENDMNQANRPSVFAMGMHDNGQLDLFKVFQQTFEQMRSGAGNGLNRVSTAPTSMAQMNGGGKGDSRSLEEVAMQFVASSRTALENAGNSLQETASTCQQNMTQLSSFIQQSLPAGAGGWTDDDKQPWSFEFGSGKDSEDDWFARLSSIPVFLRTKELEAGHKEAGCAQERRRMARGRRMREKSSLRDPGRHIAIVTTAALPWMTGTAVNPLLRAAFLSRKQSSKVTLMIPWLSIVDQARVYPNKLTFKTPEEQEQYVRNWVKQRTGMESRFRVVFYPGRYAPEKGSILPVGDLTQYIPAHEADVAVLEEPEHLNWYHHGQRWTAKFNHVVGVIHTNYLDYARREVDGGMKQKILKRVNQWVCRAHCHKIIKLSDAVQPMPRQLTQFVHGVPNDFIAIGAAKAQQVEALQLQQQQQQQQQCGEAGEAAVSGAGTGASGTEGASLSPGSCWTAGAYFLGKAVWAKGYTELLCLLQQHAERGHKPVPLAIYGSGPDLQAVMEESKAKGLPLAFHGARDHLDRSLHDYKVFVNPSLSDVVATTTAEALAMGKFVVCAQHPSNRFFSQFQNCLIYRTPEEFSTQLQHALKHDPAPLPEHERRLLSWEDATERFLDAAELTSAHLRPGPLVSLIDNLSYISHNTLSGVEGLRREAGAGANTRDSPQRVTDYVPSTEDVGGIMDDKSRAKRIYQSK